MVPSFTIRKLGRIKYPDVQHSSTMKGSLYIVLAVVLGVLLVSATVPAAAQTAPTFTVTSVTESRMRQATIGGYTGVVVNYTSHLGGGYLVLVYLTLVNATTGQAAYVGVGSCNLPPGQQTQCFVATSPSVPTGIYTASVFAVNTDNVPLSTTSTLQVAV